MVSSPQVSVLVVEDDPGIATQLVRGLERAGYTADTVTGGDTVTGSNATFPNPSTFDGSYLLLTARVFADRS